MMPAIVPDKHYAKIVRRRHPALAEVLPLQARHKHGERAMTLPRAKPKIVRRRHPALAEVLPLQAKHKHGHDAMTLPSRKVKNLIKQHAGFNTCCSIVRNEISRTKSYCLFGPA